MNHTVARSAPSLLASLTNNRRGTLCAAIVLSLALSGCSRLPRLDEVLPDKRKEYQKSESLPDLEVPPDLTTDRIQDSLAVPEISADGTASYSSYQERVAARKRARDSLQADADAVAQLADEQVVFVPGDTNAAFDGLRSFWSGKSVPLELDDAELGVLETVWLENRTGESRERFKVFSEPGQDGNSTVLYVTRDAEQRNGPDDPVGWAPAPSDPGRLASFAGALREHFGLATSDAPVEAPAGGYSDDAPASARASSAAPAEMFSAGEGRVFLSVPEDFSVVWDRLGGAIPAIGLDLIESDRSRGVYRIAVTPEEDAPRPKKGLMSRLKFWGDSDDGSDPGVREISVTGVGAKTEIVVLDGTGKWDTSATASRILGDLLDRLNGS
jgi:outer membrane protein assembly factor BamC